MKKVTLLYPSRSSWILTDKEILEDISYVDSFLVNKKTIVTSFLVVIKSILRSDILFCWFGSLTFLPFILLANCFRKKVIIISGGYDVAKTKEFKHGYFDKNIFIQFLARFLFKMADKVLCVSFFNQKEAIYNAKISKEKTKVIYLGFKEFDIPEKLEKKNQIVMIAHLNPTLFKLKGMDRFIEHANNYPEQKHLHIGKISDDIKRKIEDLGVKNLTLLGEITYNSDRFNQILLECSHIAMFSRYESFGAALIDGALRGCKPLISNCDALVEVAKKIEDLNYYSISRRREAFLDVFNSL